MSIDTSAEPKPIIASMEAEWVAARSADWVPARDDFLLLWRLYVPQDHIIEGNRPHTPDGLSKWLKEFEHEGYALDLGGSAATFATLGGGESHPIRKEFLQDVLAMTRAKFCLFYLFKIYPNLEEILRPALDRLLTTQKSFWHLAESYYSDDPKLGPLTLQAAA
ncbi:UNVERIFIED_ORG: hypothetical protein M2438_002515 [Methylobacterium sp. SuP10 SLI 274]|uniref:hypothetical protein n=1 Tax=Methylorubrum extorquens TaxID=408 RepID=UPI0020A20E4C|nr:hypothetical protein [Methylorubrum extorquens]MDF9863740.1 hypothetical protein [Methylorubrum pseudosasae]MDH6637340.1 hypothetical protein [Methylobacterium sp. SuP10 SLI 274]MDH6666520.1 hypothetical protein [Methylorubrum zatmanii]MCP1558431.1 hypothetical protein [Methylorubrum extorquens]MDF9792051.1 hypothetical protein [Methylorubrum extorquens]